MVYVNASKPSAPREWPGAVREGMSYSVCEICRSGAHKFQVRLALKGKTYRRGLKETRGRKRICSSKMVKNLDTARKRLLKKTDSDREVRWEDVRKAARAPKVVRVARQK